MFFLWDDGKIVGVEFLLTERRECGMAASGDIGIDLGTSNVVIYMKGRGVVFREPSVIAIERESEQIIAFGMEAYRMIGRTPANINIVRPLAQGEIADFDLTSSMLRYYVSNVIGKKIFARPRAILAVPSGVKELEKKGADYVDVRRGAAADADSGPDDRGGPGRAAELPRIVWVHGSGPERRRDGFGCAEQRDRCGYELGAGRR